MALKLDLAGAAAAKQELDLLKLDLKAAKEDKKPDFKVGLKYVVAVDGMLNVSILSIHQIPSFAD